MNCEEAQLAVLESLTGPPLENHLATCEVCRAFAEIQRTLDARLAAAVPVESLSPGFRNGFRTALRGKLRDHTTTAWPEVLPDLAHLIGCAVAVVLLLLLLPQYSGTVLVAGAGFTAVTYFLQAVLRSSLESRG